MKALFNVMGEALDVAVDSTEASVRAIAPRLASLLQLAEAAVKEASTALDGTKLPAAVTRYSKMQETVKAIMAPYREEIVVAAIPFHVATEELRKKFRKARGIDDAMAERLEALDEAFRDLSYRVSDAMVERGETADRDTYADLAEVIGEAARRRALTGEEVAQVAALELKLSELRLIEQELATLASQQDQIRELPVTLIGCTDYDLRTQYANRRDALSDTVDVPDRTTPATQAELDELFALQQMAATFDCPDDAADQFGAVAMHRKF